MGNIIFGEIHLIHQQWANIGQPWPEANQPTSFHQSSNKSTFYSITSFIDCDAGTLTKLINGLGVKDIQAEELDSLDDNQHLDSLKPIYGLIFVVPKGKWEPNITVDPNSPLFFAQQTTTSASVTIAAINLLINCDDSLETGELLRNLKAISKNYIPKFRGIMIENNEAIRANQNALATRNKAKAENVRFITYVPVDGKLFEMDGLREAPICLANIDREDWIKAPILKNRLQKFAASGLLAITMTPNFRKVEVLKKMAFEFMPETFFKRYLLYIRMKVNGQNGIAVVDSGACTSIVSSIFAKKWKIFEQIDPRNACNIVGIGGVTGTEGKIHLVEMQLKNNYVLFPCEIMPGMEEQMLLGLDTMLRLRSFIDLQKMVLRLGDGTTELPFLNEREYEEYKHEMAQELKAAKQAEQQQRLDVQLGRSEIFTAAVAEQHVLSLNDFKRLMVEMQAKRKEFVATFLRLCQKKAKGIEWKQIIGVICNCLQILHKTLLILDSENYQKEIISNNEAIHLDIKNEILGIRLDMKILDKFSNYISVSTEYDLAALATKFNYIGILGQYHPIGEGEFVIEHDQCVQFLRKYIGTSDGENGKKPIMITGWDGTMKDCSSQYATNYQPIYNALSMAKFSELFNRITAVVTAGPLRGPPGILDLTSLPKDGPIIFCGSLGRELWSSETSSTNYPGGTNAHALQQFSNQMDNLLESQEFSKFGLIGCGVQRKVDRLTLGVQTIGEHIHPDLSAKYQNEIRERMRRIDPNGQSLRLVATSENELEVMLNTGIGWNKGDGITHLMQAIEDNLDTGHLLICGSTHADLPMVQKAKLQNKTGVMALFVTTNQGVKQQVIHNVGDVNRCCFVSSPDVIHAAMMSILATQSAEERST